MKQIYIYIHEYGCNDTVDISIYMNIYKFKRFHSSKIIQVYIIYKKSLIPLYIHHITSLTL